MHLGTTNEQRRANSILVSLALVYFLLEWMPSFWGTYGYFIDELYYVACSKRLALGYVDHPPLSIFLLRLVRSVIGDSLVALRLVPSLAGAATVFLTGILARRLGAGLFGQMLAAGAAMVGSVYQVLFSFYSMNSLSLLMWVVCFLILVEIERRNEPRLWVAFGAVAGLGLENKHTFILLGIGLAVGLILTRARRHFRNRWLWFGLGITILLFLPNLLWQQANGWPSFEFYRNAVAYKNIPTPPLDVLVQQVLFMNPATLPIWCAGAVSLLAAPAGRSYRHLGWIFVVLILLILAGRQSRPDRMEGVYLILFAAGGVLIERLARRPRGRWLRLALPAALVLFGAALAPIGLPLLPPETAARYAGTLGIVPQIERGEGKRSELPQWLADRFGWGELVDDLEAVTATLDPDERRHAMILVPTYGQAGAVELLGRGRDLPPVYGTQNSAFHWGPPKETMDVAIVAGFGKELLDRVFEDVEPARVHHCTWCMSWRDGITVWIARKPKFRWEEVWPKFRHYE
jgi:4-amino-4-deoxy-L-arabinose transferase-like glycosyltransferase